MKSRVQTEQLQDTHIVERLNAVEDRMGQMASLLSEVAEALAEHPDGVRITGSGVVVHLRTRPDAIRVSRREWPSIEEIERLLIAWHALKCKEPSTRTSALIRTDTAF